MHKIHCPDCLNDFVWTDNMPLRGKCPTPDCKWQYDVREELRKETSKRLSASAAKFLCPHCRQPIASRIGVCEGCSQLVIGPLALSKRDALIAAVLIFFTISLILYKSRF